MRFDSIIYSSRQGIGIYKGSHRTMDPKQARFNPSLWDENDLLNNKRPLAVLANQMFSYI
jgi:hypothetical protein